MKIKLLTEKNLSQKWYRTCYGFRSFDLKLEMCYLIFTYNCNYPLRSLKNFETEKI